MVMTTRTIGNCRSPGETKVIVVKQDTSLQMYRWSNWWPFGFASCSWGKPKGLCAETSSALFYAPPRTALAHWWLITDNWNDRSTQIKQFTLVSVCSSPALLRCGSEHYLFLWLFWIRSRRGYQFDESLFARQWLSAISGNLERSATNFDSSAGICLWHSRAKR